MNDPAAPRPMTSAPDFDRIDLDPGMLTLVPSVDLVARMLDGGSMDAYKAVGALVVNAWPRLSERARERLRRTSWSRLLDASGDVRLAQSWTRAFGDNPERCAAHVLDVMKRSTLHLAQRLEQAHRMAKANARAAHAKARAASAPEPAAPQAAQTPAPTPAVAAPPAPTEPEFVYVTAETRTGPIDLGRRLSPAAVACRSVDALDFEDSLPEAVWAAIENRAETFEASIGFETA